MNRAMLGGEALAHFHRFRGFWACDIKKHARLNGETRRARWHVESPNFIDPTRDDAVFWTGADRLDAPEPAGNYPAYPEPGDA